MADNLKEAGEFAEANNNKLTLADAVVIRTEYSNAIIKCKRCQQ